MSDETVGSTGPDSEDEYEYEYAAFSESDDDDDAGSEESSSNRVVPAKPAAKPEKVGAAATAPTAFVPAARPPPSSADSAICAGCGEEEHSPVDCATREKWAGTCREMASNVMTVRYEVVQFAMKRRIREVADRLGVSLAKAGVLLRENRWNEEEAARPQREENDRDGAPSAAVGAPSGEGNLYRETVARQWGLGRRGEEDRLIPEMADRLGLSLAEAGDLLRENRWNEEEAAHFQWNENDQDGAPSAAVVAPPGEGNVNRESTSRQGGGSGWGERLRDRAARGYGRVSRGRGSPRDRDLKRSREERATSAEALLQGSNELKEPPEAAQKEASSEESVCTICFDEDLSTEQMLIMPCGHAFCRGCWAQFVELMLLETDGDNASSILATTCPVPECNEVVTEEHIEPVAPNLMPAFERLQVHSFVERASSLRWCPGPDCSCIAARHAGLFDCGGECNRAAMCSECGESFCFLCGDPPHGGNNTCAVAVTAFRASSKAFEEQSKKPIKKCPRCDVRIEKNGGCNHMSCKCGHQFCWICLGDYTGGHFCGRTDPAARRLQSRAPGVLDLDCLYSQLVDAPKSHTDELKEHVAAFLAKKERLDLFAHYYNRFAAHDQGQAFAERQRETLARRATDFTAVCDIKTGTDTDFLLAANRTLVSGRRVLKHSYVFSYFATDEAHKELFQMHQERLERFTEELSELSENACTHIDRTRVVDLIFVVDKCMNGLLAFLEYGAFYGAGK